MACLVDAGKKDVVGVMSEQQHSQRWWYLDTCQSFTIAVVYCEQWHCTRSTRSRHSCTLQYSYSTLQYSTVLCCTDDLSAGVSPNRCDCRSGTNQTKSHALLGTKSACAFPRSVYCSYNYWRPHFILSSHHHPPLSSLSFLSAIHPPSIHPFIHPPSTILPSIAKPLSASILLLFALASHPFAPLAYLA